MMGLLFIGLEPRIELFRRTRTHEPDSIRNPADRSRRYRRLRSGQNRRCEENSADRPSNVSQQDQNFTSGGLEEPSVDLKKAFSWNLAPNRLAMITVGKLDRVALKS